MDTAPDDDLFELEWGRPQRTSRLTIALVACLLVVLGFAAGALAQRAIAADSPTVVAGAPGSAPAGEMRRAGPAAAPAAPGSGAPGEQPAGEGAPTATGTIRSIEDTTLTLADDAGAIVTVTVPVTASVTATGLRGLAVGTSVAVTGTTNPDGSITATTVTAR
jgi:hypothetical protein